MDIAYLGPKNSFTHRAALGFADEGDSLKEYPTITHALLAVGKECGAAAVPYENSSEGSVSDTIDALIKYEDLFIRLEYALKIEHRLIALKTADFNNISKIVTHRQAYGQCREYLSGMYRGADIIFADSTSAAAAMINDNFTAAVGGVKLIEGDTRLKASGFTVNDQKDNRTRFILVSDKPVTDKNNDRTTIVFESENKPGGLMGLLAIFDKYKINMTKIESRPRKDIIGRYLFVVDFTGNILDAPVTAALKELREKTVFFKNLGSYRILNR